MLSQASNRAKPRGRLEEKHNLSFSDDIHSEITKCVDDFLPKALWNHQKQHGGVKAGEEDELVKYMSRLPSYLEKGKYPREKVLSVGVLDWGRLEQWQLSHKKVTHRSSMSSLFGSNASSSFSTDESSADSGRGCSGSPPACQRARRLSLQFDMMSSPQESDLNDVRKPQDHSAARGKTFNVQEKCTGGNKSSIRSHPAMKMEQFKGKDTSIKSKPECVTSDGVNSKVKIGRQDGKPIKKLEKIQKGNPDNVEQEFSGARVDGGNLSQLKSTGLADAITKEISRESSHSIQHPAKTGCSPAKSRNLDRKVTSIKPAIHEPSKGTNAKVSMVEPEKVRSTSPFRHFSFSIGKMGKSSTANDSSDAPQRISEHASAKCDSEIALASRSASTFVDKRNSASKGKSSPLKRLLDPLLKPRLVNCSDGVESVQKPSERAFRSSHGRRHASTTSVSSEKVKSCRTVNLNGSSEGQKNGPSVIQALFRVQVKNGLPLFTFAVNNESDILAATVKMFSASSIDDHDCIFTFFSIQEGTKKNGRWIKQGGKGKGRDCIPNIVAQMKVYCSDISHLSGQNCIDQFRIREYVLLGLDLGQKQTNQQTSGFQQNDELAAIVMKIPRRTTKSSAGDESQTDERIDSQNAEEKFDSNFVKKSRDIDTTVVLPSGVHSLPSKGGPSSLIQRWKTGGSCDCGGWDLGCKLKVLTRGNQLSKISSSTKTLSSADKFELFFEGGLPENLPFFNMTLFKDGSYSIEFSSSLSPMQAFSICLAVWDSRRLHDLSESVNSFEDRRTPVETTLQQNAGISAPNLTEGDAPARYVSCESYPPLSPVGRV